MLNSQLYVSFIIPCHNEAEIIEATINTIKKELKDTNLSYEIIVVDNLSDDESKIVASNAGAQVFSCPADTVAAVRNYGCSKSRGEILVFLDADVHLSAGWGSAFSKIIRLKKLQTNKIIGSHCSVPPSIKEPLASWYLGIENDARNTHLGTGHMVMTKDFFMNLGMFDEKLKTGEDFEFCQRAFNSGANIEINKKLKAYHMGYPENLGDFIKRESWHGGSDFGSVSSIIHSKVAISAVFFIALNATLLYQIATGSFLEFLFTLVILVAFLSIIVIVKFGFVSVNLFFPRVIVSYFYLLGRAMSLKEIIR